MLKTKTYKLGILALIILGIPSFSYAQSSGVQDILQNLLKQAEGVTQILDQQKDEVKTVLPKPTPKPAPRPAKWCDQVTGTLQTGRKGSDVKALQNMLRKDGFRIDAGEFVSSTYGSSTAAAVKGFQEKYKDDILTPVGLFEGSGVVTSRTRNKLNSLYGCASAIATSSLTLRVDAIGANLSAFSSLPQLTIGKNYNFKGRVTGIPIGGEASFNLQRPDGKMKYQNQKFVYAADKNGYFTHDGLNNIAIADGADPGIYGAWIEYKGNVSNKVYFQVVRPAQLEITTDSDLNGAVGQKFSGIFSVSGGGADLYEISYDKEKTPLGLSWSKGAECGEDADCPDRSPNSIFLSGIPKKSGKYTITISAKDGSGASVERDFDLIIGEGNGKSDPVISGVKGPTELRTGETGTWTVTAYDPGDQKLNFSVLWGDQSEAEGKGVRANSYEQVATFTHNYRTGGTYAPQFLVSNGSDGTARTKISVGVKDQVSGTLSISPASLNLNIGQTGTLAAYYQDGSLRYPVKAQWTSSDSSVATVSPIHSECTEWSGCSYDQAVKGIDPGIVKITASFNLFGSNRPVAADALISVSGSSSSGTLRIKPESLKLKVNEVQRVIAWYYPPMPECVKGQACVQVMPAPVQVDVNWSSSDNSVVGLSETRPLCLNEDDSSDCGGKLISAYGIKNGSARINAVYLPAGADKELTARIQVTVDGVAQKAGGQKQTASILDVMRGLLKTIFGYFKK